MDSSSELKVMNYMKLRTMGNLLQVVIAWHSTGVKFFEHNSDYKPYHIFKTQTIEFKIFKTIRILFEFKDKQAIGIHTVNKMRAEPLRDCKVLS